MLRYRYWSRMVFHLEEEEGGKEAFRWCGGALGA